MRKSRKIITASIFAILALVNPSEWGSNMSAQAKSPELKILPEQKIPEEPQFVEGEILLKIKETQLPSSAAFKEGKAFARGGASEESSNSQQGLRHILQERRVALLKLGVKFAKNYNLRIIAIHPITGIVHFRVTEVELVGSVIKQILEENPDVVDYVVRNSKGYLLSHINVPFPPNPNDKAWSLHVPTVRPDGTPGIDIPMLWGLEKIGMQEAWTDARGGDVVVAVIDSGIDTTHPDLQQNLWTNFLETKFLPPGNDGDGNCFIDDIHGANFLAYNIECLQKANVPGFNPGLIYKPKPCMYLQTQGDISDENGHGTYMAGIIGAVGNNQIPDDSNTPADESDRTATVGVNWTLKLMGLKTFCIESGNTDQGFPQMYTDQASNVDAIEYAIQMGAHIINASWIWPAGSTINQMQPLFEAVQKARDAGILFVTGAGNNGRDNAYPNERYPASFTLDNIVTVAATGFNDAVDPNNGCIDVNDKKSDCLYINSNFSSSGTVHIAAPGWYIVGTGPPSLPLTPLGGNCGSSPCMPPDEEYLAASSNTSPAAALVSGCGALLQAIRKSLSLPLLSPFELKTLLINSGDQPRDSAGHMLLDRKTIDGRRLNCHEAIHRLPICATGMGTAGDPPENEGVSP